MYKPEQLNIVCLYSGSAGFPLGDAYTNRVLAIAKGLVSIKCNVKILIIYPGRRSGVLHKRGVFDSIPYEYLTPLRTSKRNYVKKLIGILGILNACYQILARLRGIDAIISFSESMVQNNTIGYFAHIKKITFIRETNEYPGNVLKKGINGLSDNDKRNIKTSLKYIDGLICISNSLDEFFRVNHSFNRPILVVPILVDKDRFTNLPLKTRERFITYCGNIFGEKDGVNILVRAFAVISKNHPDYKLKLIGDIGEIDEYEKLKQLTNSLDVADKVFFTGYIKREEIPFHLVNSDVLALARPSNLQTEGGFPTKLGEYLATGKPVVVTSVSDIPEYIRDGINGFLAKPGSLDSFVEKLDYVLTHYREAEAVGRKGKEVIDKVFDAKIQAVNITEFISRLKTGRN